MSQITNSATKTYPFYKNYEFIAKEECKLDVYCS